MLSFLLDIKKSLHLSQGISTLPGDVNTPGTRAEEPETEYHHCSAQGSPIWGGNKHAGKTGFGMGVSQFQILPSMLISKKSPPSPYAELTSLSWSASQASTTGLGLSIFHPSCLSTSATSFSPCPPPHRSQQQVVPPTTTISMYL